MVFRTNRVHLSDTDWKNIRLKLKKAKWTRYKFKFNEERFKKYFNKNVDYLKKAGPDEILKKAGANMWLSCGTVFCSFPRIIYRWCSIDTWEYMAKGLKNGNVGGLYERRNDSWIADMIGSVTGWTTYGRKKYSYEKPGVMLNLEIFDIHIANRKLKEKMHLIKCDRKKLDPRENPRVNMFKIKIG